MLYLVVSLVIFLYLLIGLTYSYTIVKYTDSVVEKHESNHSLNEAEEELLDKLEKINSFGRNTVLIIFVITTLFWLPIKMIGWMSK